MFKKLLKNYKGLSLLEYPTITGAAAAAIGGIMTVTPHLFEYYNAATDKLLDPVQVVIGQYLSVPPSAEPAIQVVAQEEAAQIESTAYACFNEGILAAGTTKIRSLNHFGAGFCLHGNEGVWLRNNNIFETGAVVSSGNEAPNTPGNSNNNEGLLEAYQIARMNIDVDESLESAMAGLLSGARPSYLDQTAAPISVSPTKISPSDFTQGQVHSIECWGNNNLKFGKDFSGLSNIAIVTNCSIQFSQDMLLENVIIATTNTSDNSIHSPSELTLGRNDSCQAGSGAQILTLGGAQIAAKMDIYGGHFVAAKDIDISAQITGQGALMLSGQNISNTSLIQMQACGFTKTETQSLESSWWEITWEY